MNEWQVLMAMEARYERGRCRHRPAARRFWGRWSCYGMKQWRCWGRGEMVAVLEALQEELEATIAADVAGIMEA